LICRVCHFLGGHIVPVSIEHLSLLNILNTTVEKVG